VGATLARINVGSWYLV